MYIIAMIALVLCVFVIMDWYSRGTFIARGYVRRNGHGKTWKRAKKHYKSNWSFWERMIWKPIFSEYYGRKFKTMVVLAYIHFILLILTIAFLLFDEFLISTCTFWHYIFIAFSIFSIVRYVHSNAIATK